MTATVAGSFNTGSNVAGIADQQSGVLVIQTSTTTAKLTLSGLDANNRVKSQKSTNNGSTWADQTTYNADQSAVGVTVAAGEHWRLQTVAMQAIRTINFKLSAES